MISSISDSEGRYSFEKRVGALPPVFSANFMDEGVRLYNNPELKTEGVEATQGGLELGNPGKSFVELEFNIAQKSNLPFILFINPAMDQNVLVTVNGTEISSDMNITSLIQEGKNVVRVELRASANSTFTLAQLSLSRRMNGLRSNL